MATNFNEVFGNMPTQMNSNTAGNNQQSQQKPKSQFWLNLGYHVNFQDDQGEDQVRFVSLPMGIALDTMDKVPTTSTNQYTAGFNAARNNLVDQLIAKAQELNPGEETTVNLTIQLRRVNDEAHIDNSVNPFIKQLDL